MVLMRTLYVFVLALLLLPIVGASDDWFNTSWNYRVGYEVSASPVERTGWPAEIQINFADLLRQKNASGGFDFNSPRVFEYNAGGRLLWEVPFQFDNGPVRGTGTLVFLMNGTTPIGAKRRFLVYFDSLANGPKPPVHYSSQLAYAAYGDEFNVNNSLLRYYVDRQRGEGTSGFYRVQGALGFQVTIFEEGGSGKTIEFQKYSDGTRNFSFDYVGGKLRVTSGPIRMTVEQFGEETLYGTSQKTGQAYMAKRYVFYENTPWARVEQDYRNTAGESIVRKSLNSTALAFDAGRAFLGSYQSYINESAPAPYAWVTEPFGSTDVAVLLLTSQWPFSVQENQPEGIAGINLDEFKIQAGGVLSQKAVMSFNDTGANEYSVQRLGIALKSFGYSASSPEFINETYCYALYPQIVYPNGQGFLRTGIVPLLGRVVDNCGNAVENATVSWGLRKAPSSFTCSNLSGVGGGWYNCSWQSGTTMGYYNVTFNASKAGYLPGSTRKANAFFLGAAPVLDQDQVNPVNGTVGTWFRFSVRITDVDLNRNRLELWTSNRNLNNWKLLNFTVVSGVGVNSRTYSFNHNMTCKDVGLNYFHFNTTDEFNFTAQTPDKTFTVFKSGTC